MNLSFLTNWEWLIIELIVLGLAVRELVSLHLYKRREAQRQNEPPTPPT